MSCTRFIMVLLPLTTSLALLTSITYFVSQGGCPEGNFSCGNGSVCVLQRLICDGKSDCPNGEDEEPLYCADLHGGFWELVGNLKYRIPNDTCELDRVEDGCLCTDRSVVVCKGLGWTALPLNMSTSATRMILSENDIELKNSTFVRFSLMVIHLGRNKLKSLPHGLLKTQIGLEKLFLSGNDLEEVPPNSFNGLDNLAWLFLNNNRLKTLHMEYWKLDRLFWLELSANQLTLENESFPPLPSLSLLYLDSNMIKVITPTTFSNLPSLKDLSLKRNLIETIDSRAFANQLILQDLDLSFNRLEVLEDGLFSFGKNLEKLNLGGNPINWAQKNLFVPLSSLRSLGLEDIEIDNIDISMFSLLHNLDFIYFKKFKYCTYAPNVPKCSPLTDGVSSLSDLLAARMVRVTLWIVATFILVTNSMVLWRRISAPTGQSSPLSLVIANLAGADLLMGVYLLIVGWQDVRFRGTYKEFAHAWTSSWLCTAAGVVAMISSEVSVLILLLISAERFLLIAAPFNHHGSLSDRGALGSILCIWTFTIIVALIPVVHWRHTVRFYGSNGLCFPLHIDEPYFVGWQYSAFVFIGLNSAGLFGIAGLYAAVFSSIWRTRKATTITLPDSDFALRFFFIFLTNASCWIPIIVLKIMAFLHINFTGELYGWLAIFVIPLNSAVNPILYTFTAPNYRFMLNHFTLNCRKLIHQGRETSNDCTNKTAVFPNKLPMAETISTNCEHHRNCLQ